MNRPLVWAAVAFAAGAAMGEAGWVGLPWIPFVALGLGGMVLILQRSRRRDRLACVLLFAGAGGLLWYARHGGPPGDDLGCFCRAHPEARVTLSGRARSAPVVLPGDDYATFVVDVWEARYGEESERLRGRTQVAWSNPAPGVCTGDTVTCSGVLDGRLGPVNHGILDSEDYLRRQGVYTRLRVRGDAVECTGASRWRPGHWASRLRQWQAVALQRAAPAAIVPFLRAVWLGDRGGVDPGTRRALRDSGTVHILTVSGVHVGIVALCLGYVLPVFVRSRKARALLTMGGVIVFALASGMRPSSLRATLMVCTYLAADLFGRERDAPTALAIAALVLLTGRPALVGHTGFILSFSCVASILLFADPLKARLTWLPRWLRGAVAASLGVSVLAWPLSASYFHVLPLLGPLANVLAVPLVTIVLWLCLATELCAAMLPPAVALLGHATYPFVALTEGVAHVTAAVPMGHFNVSPPSLPAMLCWFAATALLYRALRAEAHARRWFAATAVALFLALAAWGMTPRPAGVHFLDVGQGDAAFVRTPGGTTMLVDAGDATEYGDMGERVVDPFLRANGVGHIDFAVVSHPDRDHLGGYFHLLDAFRVGVVILPPAHSGARLEDALLARCAARGVPVHRVSCGDQLAMTGATAEVLHPPAQWGEHEIANERSIVLRVRWPGMSVLFTGDIEHAGETALAGVDCHADILKVPHHGSHTSSSAALLDAVAPRVAVCSTTRAPSFIMDRYTRRGIAMLRTDHYGGVRVTTEDGEPVFLGARASRGYTLAPSDGDG